MNRCAPLDVEQFQPATTTEMTGSDSGKDEVSAVVELKEVDQFQTRTSDGVKETSSDHKDEVTAVVELNEVDQFQTVTSDGVKETSSDHKGEVSAVVELNDETGAFEYTLYSITAPPKIKLYVPGKMQL